MIMNSIDIFINFYMIPMVVSFILIVIYSMLSSFIFDYDLYGIIKSVWVYIIFPITNIILIIILLLKLVPLIISFLVNSFCDIWKRL